MKAVARVRPTSDRWTSSLSLNQINHMVKSDASPEVYRFSAQRVAAEFDEALKWMSSLGIRTNSGRIFEYAKVLSNWAVLPEANDTFAAHALSPAMRSAVLDSNMFISVHRAFHKIPQSELGGIVDKLKMSIGGPADVADETEKASAPRNFLFEAVVAANFYCPNQGVHTFLSSPSDTGFTYLSRHIFVECKRLGSVNGIENNVRKACNQLTVALNEDSTSRHGGLIALDISNIISTDTAVADEKLLTSHMAKQMDQFIESSSIDWQKVYPQKDPRIFGALFRFSRLIQSEFDGLWVIATEWGVNPRQGLGWSETRYMQRLARALQSGSRDRNRSLRRSH